ncbi:MAG: CpsB/CapC family capsule biosynthesis tyrosine phosphatase [Lachnospiraceae bacterium]
MIDIHSHVLPRMADGAKDEQESLEMLKMAWKCGITHMIATPHSHYKKGNASSEQIKSAVRHMQNVLEQEGIPLKLYAGNELFYTHNILEKVKNGEVLTLADSDYVLLEFSVDAEKNRIRNAVYEFYNHGFLPIVAHVERYQVFLKDQDFAEEILEMGAYFQVNMGSLGEHAGWRTRHFVKGLIRNDMLHFIATDAHDTVTRKPYKDKGLGWIEKKYGQKQLENYLWRNQKKVLNNESI